MNVTQLLPRRDRARVFLTPPLIYRSSRAQSLSRFLWTFGTRKFAQPLDELWSVSISVKKGMRTQNDAVSRAQSSFPVDTRRRG